MSVLIALWIASASASISVETPPVLGVGNVVVVTDSEERPRGGETVRVVHRPGLDGEREVAIGITDGLGRVRWKPEAAGVATVKAGDEILPVHIGWPVIPSATALLLVMLLLAAAAAAGYGIRTRSSTA